MPMISKKEFIEKEDELITPADYQDYLNNKLRSSAEEKISNSIGRALRSINFLIEGVLPKTTPSLEHDQSFSFSTLFILKKLGLLDALIKTQPGEKQELQIKDISVAINRFSNMGFSLAFLNIEGLEEKKESLLQELKNTPFWQLFEEASKSHFPGDKTSTETKSFSFGDDLLANTVLFSRLNILEGGFRPSACQSQESLEELAKESLLNTCLKHLSVDDLGNLKSINFSLDEGITLSLLPTDEGITEDDLLVTNWKVQISSQIERQMMEVANQNSQSRCEAFIQRPTGQILLEALKHANLKFSPDFEKFLTMDKTSNFNDRYGGPYTHISRLLAKILWSRKLERITDLFVNQKNGQPSSEELSLLIDYPNTDLGFSTLQDILRQLLDRDINDNNSDISVLPTKIDVSDGACFDVSTYYCQALNYGQLYLKLINGKAFLLKTHGARTLINLQPILFNGISLPKGSLFTMTDENEFAFLRLTPFMFDNREDMISAFGTEVIKAEDSGEDLLAVANYSW
jgi:hypothetical protein